MDEELEQLRRTHHEGPADVGTALRLAVSLERTGLVVDAWDCLAAVAPRSTGKSVERVQVAASALAGRQPRILAERLASCDGAQAHRTIDLLGAIGAVHVLAATACDRAVPVARRTDIAIGLERAVPLEERVGDPVTFRREVERMLARAPAIADELAWMEPDAGRQGFTGAVGQADALIARARRDRLVRLLPWLAELLDVSDAELAERARDAFRSLTGRDEPPVDVVELRDRKP